ncbi:MAG: type II methionyl aminopeptidase [Nanohaloarchaea archaeon SW_7_46_7]|nr:MAG: type II methionyl aminopeptidase [Nanohaloarchaea archaeon SW_7_46_7]
MEEEVKQKYVRSGEVIQKARKKAREIAEPGVEYREIADTLEDLIRNEGLEPAFPVNLSADEEAAHYSPGTDTERVVGEDEVLKIDIGAHCDGYIADTAITVNPSGKHQEMIETNREILEKALEFVEPGKTVGEFGTFVQNQIPDEYNVVRNLTGHYLGHYTQHAGVSIPNNRNASNHVFEKGDAIAIEPFLTKGSGKIKEGKEGNIYLGQGGNVRGRAERKLLKQVKGFEGLPFSPRWFDSFSGRDKMALKKLVQAGAVKSYPILREVDKGIVTQAEHTVLVGVDGGENIVTTRSD